MNNLIKRALCIMLTMLFCTSSVSCSTDANNNEITSSTPINLTETENASQKDEYCSPLQKYVPYISIEASDNANNLINNNIIHAVESYSYKLETAPNPANTELTISFMGEQFVGKYSNGYNSKKTEKRNQYKYNYLTENGEKFSTDELGRLVAWKGTKNSTQCIPTNNNEIISLEDAITICKGLLPTDFCNKFSEYTIEIYGDPNTTPDCTAYSIAFISSYNGIKVSQQVSFTLGLNGELLNYGTINLGRYDSKTIPADFDQTTMDNIIKEMFVDENAQYVTERRRISILSDGTLSYSVLLLLYENGEYLTSLGVDIPLE